MARFSGRQGGKRTLRTSVTNKGMAERANRRLHATVENAADKFEEALAVDGNPVIIWNRQQGHYPCACRRVPGSFYAVEILGEDGKAYTVDAQPGEYRAIRTDVLQTDPKSLEEFFNNDLRESTTTPKDVITSNYGTPDNSESDPLSDDGLMPGDVFADTDAFLNSVAITCPICYNSGYTDGWSIFGGDRYILDFSGTQYVDIVGGEFNESNKDSVPEIQLEEGESVTWEVDFPITWKLLMRMAVFYSEDVLSRHDYKLELQLPDQQTWQTIENIRWFNTLNGNSAMGGTSKIRITPADGVASITFTHVDFIFAMQKPVRAQIPEIEVPYEEEYVDWNLNVAMEISAKADIREGSYVVDFKYKKVWKIDSFNKRMTSGNVVFGYQVNCRALQPFEKLYSLFNVFTKK